MNVILAGFNLDAAVVDKIRQLVDTLRQSGDDSKLIASLIETLGDEPLTPETISAAYARISRSQLSIGELRRDARASVNRSRQSNERIIFGFGHASIAEHAVFNFDISGISRLALEELESHRLASFTEGSQRYISMGGDYLIPEEVKQTGLEGEFASVCDQLFHGYRDLLGLLAKHHGDLPDRDLEVKALEDARYLLPLACRGQVGMTVNARNLEYMILNFNHSPLAELRELGRQLLEPIRRVAPSLIRHTDLNSDRVQSETDLRLRSDDTEAKTPAPHGNSVVLIAYPEMDEKFALAALLFSQGSGSFSHCLETVTLMSQADRRQLALQAHKCIGAHDSILRPFELGQFTFGIILSASAFAQLKRHRMATIIRQPYQTSLGVTVPPNVTEAGGGELLHRCIGAANHLHARLHQTLEPKDRDAAQYILTNSHQRRVLFAASARELTHLSRLRLDQHAQWDIRGIAGEMIRLAREKCPGLLLFAGAKDGFAELQRDLFGELQ